MAVAKHEYARNDASTFRQDLPTSWTWAFGAAASLPAIFFARLKRSQFHVMVRPSGPRPGP